MLTGPQGFLKADNGGLKLAFLIQDKSLKLTTLCSFGINTLKARGIVLDGFDIALLKRNQA